MLAKLLTTQEGTLVDKVFYEGPINSIGEPRIVVVNSSRVFERDDDKRFDGTRAIYYETDVSFLTWASDAGRYKP